MATSNTCVHSTELCSQGLGWWGEAKRGPEHARVSVLFHTQVNLYRSDVQRP